MDLDEWEWNDDDDLISSLVVEEESFQTNNLSRNEDKSDYLMCHPSGGFVHDFEKIDVIEEYPPEFDLFGVKLNTLIDELILGKVFQMARCSMLELQSGKSSTSLTKKKRETITNLLYFVRNNFEDFEDLTNNLRLIESILENENFIPGRHMMQHDGRDKSSYRYQYSHGYLEWRWISLTVIYKMETRLGMNSLLRFENSLHLLIHDLLFMSWRIFEQTEISSLSKISCFECDCFNDIWNLILKLCNHLYKMQSSESFWTHFTKVFNVIKDCEINGNSIFNTKRNKIPCKQFDIFLLWFIGNFLKANSEKEIPENNNLIQSTVINILNETESESTMRVVLKQIKAIESYWPLNAEILSQMWEYYYKKINTNFFVISRDSASALLVPNDSALSYVTNMKSVDMKEEKQTSFLLFLSLLKDFFSGTTDQSVKNQQKLLNRILLKFTPRTWSSLNEIGIHNLNNLFILIYIITNEKKILDRLEGIYLAVPIQDLNPNRRLYIIKGLLGLLILLYSKEDRSVNEFPANFMKKIEVFVATETNVARALFHGMETIFEGTQTFDKGQHILFDSWITTYLKTCSENDRESVLEFLTFTIKKLNTGEENPQKFTLIQKIITLIKPYLISIWSLENGPDLSDLVVGLCVASTGRNNLPKRDDVLSSFMMINSKNTRSQANLCLQIVNLHIPVSSSLLIQFWIKCLMIADTPKDILMDITQIIVQTKEYKDLSSSRIEDYETSNQFMTILLKGIAPKYNQILDVATKESFEHKFRIYFKYFERWALPSLATEVEAGKTYSLTTAICFYCCDIIYSPRNTDFFKMLISNFYLPSSLLAGKQQSVSIVRSLCKIFHIFMDSLSSLDWKTDQYLRKLVSDLMFYWTIPFKNENSSQHGGVNPFIRLFRLKNEEFIEFSMESLCKCYFVKKSNGKELIVLDMLKELYKSISVQDKSVVIYTKSVLITAMDYYINCEEFSPARKLILSLMEYVTGSAKFKESSESIKLILESILKMTSTMMAFKSSAYFEFMLKFVKIAPGIVRKILPQIRNQIVEVEFSRASGMDSRLRQQLTQLESLIFVHQNTR